MSAAQLQVLQTILSPLQHARAEVASFPALHDAVGVGDEVLRRRGQAAADCAGGGTLFRPLGSCWEVPLWLPMILSI